jgi:hypothetical protein
MPLVAARQNFSKRGLASFLPQSPETLDRRRNFGRAPIRVRDDAGDRFAVPGDADGAAALHFVQKLRPLGFGFRSLIFENVCHCFDQSI